MNFFIIITSKGCNSAIRGQIKKRFIMVTSKGCNSAIRGKIKKQ